MGNGRLAAITICSVLALAAALALLLAQPVSSQAGTLILGTPFAVFVPALGKDQKDPPPPSPTQTASPTATSTVEPSPTPTSTVTPSPTPEPDLLIRDRYGQEQDWDWVIENFGAVTLDRGDGSASVTVLQEVEGPTVLVAHVEQGGQPVVDFPVMFFWPDAPPLDPSLWACGKDRALVIPTKENGNAEFAMGPGSFYFPPGETGPHVVWVGGPGSDCLGGLGMLGATNHVHLDSSWVMPEP